VNNPSMYVYIIIKVKILAADKTHIKEFWHLGIVTNKTHINDFRQSTIGLIFTYRDKTDNITLAMHYLLRLSVFPHPPPLFAHLTIYETSQDSQYNILTRVQNDEIKYKYANINKFCFVVMTFTTYISYICLQKL